MKYYLLFVLSVIALDLSAQSWRSRNNGTDYDIKRARVIEENNRRVTRQNMQRYEQQERANQQRREARQRKYMQEQERANQQRRETRQREYMQEQEQRRVNDEDSRTATIVQSNANNMPQSNDKIVSLVVSGTGSTKEEATKNALRSAIEQTFGTFVSANTEVLNDDLIKDEIISVTSGNIENYSIISSDNTFDGKTTVIVKATVSIGKLVQYAQSKGASVELAGATFAMNMKIRKMETSNEYQVLLMLRKQMCQIAKQGIYDYKVTIEDPSLNYYCRYPANMPESQIRQYNNSYKVEIRIDYIPNKNAEALVECIYRTLKGISIPLSEVESYKKAGLPV